MVLVHHLLLLHAQLHQFVKLLNYLPTLKLNHLWHVPSQQNVCAHVVCNAVARLLLKMHVCCRRRTQTTCIPAWWYNLPQQHCSPIGGHWRGRQCTTVCVKQHSLLWWCLSLPRRVLLSWWHCCTNAKCGKQCLYKQRDWLYSSQSARQHSQPTTGKVSLWCNRWHRSKAKPLH